ncbi:MAG TPA: DUF4389 domain-containing protein [Solirubrobacteraceae bacterium]|nr:DUF4389 domain-containing protein [Solirubrobacteraceae bacterium]
MREHPIRLVVSDDDLERLRITVFFRALLAVPHFIWLLLWSIAALLAAIASWFATLALARSPQPLHRFLAAYVKYVTQFYAYLHLAAERYPPFDGQDGYPVDLRIAAPARQSRLGVLFRGVLLLPAVLLVSVLVGDPTGGLGSLVTVFTSNVGLLPAVALLAWFASLARSATPRGLRDAILYPLSYGAQFWAYALLLTDRYPDSDPQALAGLPALEHPIRLELGERDGLRRSRLTVFFRALLSLPHIVWLELWGVLVLFAAIAIWFATLVRGRSPERLHRFLAAYVRYQFHVYAFLYLVANPFPGFVGARGSYPLEIAVAERAPQNRWKTAFRVLLVLPALLLAGAYGAVANFVGVLAWFSALARGRVPLGLRNAGALALRYQSQVFSYALLLTDVYPYSGPVLLGRPAEGATSSTSSAASEPQGPPTWRLTSSPDEPADGGGR